MFEVDEISFMKSFSLGNACLAAKSKSGDDHCTPRSRLVAAPNL